MNIGKARQTEGDASTTYGGNELEELEKLKGIAKRFGRQAEVMNDVSAELEQFTTSHSQARPKYTDARNAANLEIMAIRTSLENVRGQLTCRLDDDQTRCLNEAADKVFADIETCSDSYGCVSPCDDSPAGDPDDQWDVIALAAEIARRRKNLSESGDYFKALVAEPVDMASQVEKHKLASDMLHKQIGGEGVEPAELYANWLILEHEADLARIGHGFTSVSAYLDCMGTVLSCLTTGWTSVALLEGRKSELEEMEVARRLACQKRKDDPLHFILALYDKCSASDKASSEADEISSSHGENGKSTAVQRDNRPMDSHQEYR